MLKIPNHTVIGAYNLNYNTGETKDIFIENVYYRHYDRFEDMPEAAQCSETKKEFLAHKRQKKAEKIKRELRQAQDS